MQFVGRKQWMDRFNDYMYPDEGLIWRITGVPGIGKSTLMRKFAQRCEEAGRMHVFLNIEGLQAGHGLDILSELSKSARYFDTENSNKTLREKMGERFVQYKDGLGSVLEAGKLVDPSGGLIAGGAKVLLDLGSGLAGSAANMSEEAAAVHPELFLLNALAAAADGARKPICLVDTFEHALAGNLKLQSRLDFGFAEPRESTLKTQPLAAWLLSLFEFLRSKGWRVVIAGRNMKGAAVKDQLNRFTRDEIAQAASQRHDLKSYMTDQADAIIDVLATLSFEGNPLWLQVAMNLLENLLAQGEDLEALAKQPDYLHQCFEEEDPFDSGEDYGIEGGQCKLQLIGTLTRHIEGLEDQAWKIALPRVLDKGIVGQLFEAEQARVVLHNFNVAGVFRHNGKQFSLHEEIRDLLLAYARSKGWLESEETRTIHGRLWDYLNALYPDASEHSIWQLEAIYHRLYSLSNTLGHLDKPAAFVMNLLGSSLLTTEKKWMLAAIMPKLTVSQIDTWAGDLKEEQGDWENTLGVEVRRQLLQDLSIGKARSAGDILYWNEQIKSNDSVGHYFAFIQMLKNLDQSPEYLVEAVDAMLVVHGETNDLHEKEQCAAALYNKGMTLAEKLNKPKAAIASYDDLLSHYGTFEQPVTQEQCAAALYNKGMILAEKLNKPEAAIASYDDLLSRYGAIESSAIQEQCAKALFNKGVALADKPESAIASYDDLLSCYGTLEQPTIQELCAKALSYKGVMLSNQLNNPEAVIASYDDLLSYYGVLEQSVIQEQCAKALLNKGWILGNKLNNPEAEVVSYGDLLHRYGALEQLKFQWLCAAALYSKGITLANKLNKPEAAIASYDDLLSRYGAIELPAIQEQCAETLFNKGVTLSYLGNLPAVVNCYEDLLTRYAQIESPKIQQQCQNTRANLAELLIVVDQPKASLNHINQLLEQYDRTNQTFAIMHFLRWIAVPETPQQTILNVIRELPADVKFAWSWNEIRPLIDKLPEPRKTQASHFIAFFEDHQDVERLERELESVMS